MRHRKQDDDTGVSEMKAFGEELIATGARYIEAGKRWFETRRDESAAQRHAHAHGGERQRPTRDYDSERRGPDDDGHGRSAWLGGRPSRPDLYGQDDDRGSGQGHAFWDEPPHRDPDQAGRWRQEHRWQPDDAPSGQDRRTGMYGSSAPLRDSDDRLSDWGHRARPGQDRSDAQRGWDRSADTGPSAHAPGGWRGVGPKGYTRSDTRINEDVCERLTHDDAIDARGISVQVRDGVVTLDGHVQQRSIKHRVEDLVERCAGVRDIENRLRVQRDDARSVRDTPSPDASVVAQAAASPHSTGHTGGLDAQGAAATSSQSGKAASGVDADAPDDDGNPHRP